MTPLDVPEPRLSSDEPTDLWLAEQLLAAHPGAIHYADAWGWVVWNGRYWRPNDEPTVANWLKATVRDLYATLATLEPDSARYKALHTLLKKALSSPGAASVLKQLTTEPGVFLYPEDLRQFDADPLLLNCWNGTVDLRTGRLRPHCPHDRLTRCLRLSYDPEAPCPRWEAFLAHDLNADQRPELLGFIQRAVGYSVTGEVHEKCLFFAYGPPNTGKSTFVETLQALFDADQYGAKVPIEMLMDTHNPASTMPYLAKLEGKRLVVLSETERGQKLRVALVKDLVGKDTISAKRLYHDPYDYRPTFKLWMYGNDQPKVSDPTDAIWTKLFLLPFDVIIPVAQRDGLLQEKLRAELPGILAWAVRGTQAWLHGGLQVPDCVRLATQAYRDDQDWLGQFLTEMCYFETAATVTVAALYSAYRLWAERSGIHSMLTKLDFNKRLRERGLDTQAGGGNVLEWRGVGLADGNADDAPAEEYRKYR